MKQTTEEYELGTDIDRNWIINSEGRLQTISGKENLVQAIENRLTCYFDNLDWAYKNYGSYMKDWLGKVDDPYTRSTLIKEITTRVSQDPRIKNVTVTIIDWTPYMLGIRIDGTITQNSTPFQEYFIFGDKQHKVTIDTYNDTFRTTHIITRGRGYYSTPGNTLKVHAHILDENDRRVPIGQVSLWMGEQYIETREIEQSGDHKERTSKHGIWTNDLTDNDETKIHEIKWDYGQNEPGSVTFNLTIPQYFEYGNHYLKIKYHGINGYNPCTYTCRLIILEKLPTTTQLTEESLKYYVDDYALTHPGVDALVDDINLEPVNMGYANASIEPDHPHIIQLTNPIIYLGANLYNEDITIITKPLLSKLTRRYIFTLSRRIYPEECVKLVDANTKTIDYLRAYYDGEKYYLVTTEIDYEPDILLKVYE